MPLYEYRCESCNKTFEIIAKQQAGTAPCPTCGKDAKKIVSVFAASNCSSPAGSGFG